eukprot:Tbor_TRINITY_DN5583_c2_g1::TRINITY_DN5583_c2_g1_i1::g.13722::m.13722
MGNGQSIAEISKIVYELSTRDVTLADKDVWRKILLTPFTLKDLNSAMRASDLRRMRQYHPCSLASLIYCAVEQLDIFTTAKLKLPPSDKSFNVILSVAAEKAANNKKDPEVTYQTAVNCLLLIAKIMPYALERDVITVSKEPPTLPGKVSAPPPSQTLSKVHSHAKEFMYYVLSENLTLEGITSKNGEENGVSHIPIKFPIETPLSTLMANALVRAALTPNFTIGNYNKPVNLEDSLSNLDFVVVDNSVLWSSGVGGSHDCSTKATWALTNRRHVLSAIVSTLTSQVYEEDPLEPDSLFRSVYTDIKLCPQMPTFVTCMLNTIGNYNAFGKLPYSSHITDEIEALVLECAEVLSLLADTSMLPSIRDKGMNGHANTSISDGPEKSISSHEKKVADDDHLNKHSVWGVFRALSHKESLFIFRSIVKLISTRSHAKTSTLKYTQRALPRYDGFFILFFKFIDHCPSFFNIVSQDEFMLKLIVPILDYIDDITSNRLKVSQAQLGLFTLMRLSSSRGFAVLCNEKVKESLSFHLDHFEGTYNDLLVMSMFKWIGTREDANTRKSIKEAKAKAKREGKEYITSDLKFPTYGLIALHETCAIIVTNISPYMTSVSIPTAFQLVSAFETMTRPKWLCLHQSYPNILLLTVEAMTNIIQYQFSGCAPLIYTISRFKCVILALYDAIMGASAITASENNNNNNNENNVKKCSLSVDEAPLEEIEEDFSMSLPSSQIDGSVVQAIELGNQYQEKKYHIIARIADLSGDKYIPRKIKDRIQIGTLKCVVELAETVMVKALLGHTSTDLIQMIEKCTFVGAMPAPHHIIIRKFDSHQSIDKWLANVLWGVLFTVFRFSDGKAVKLFDLM